MSSLHNDLATWAGKAKAAGQDTIYISVETALAVSDALMGIPGQLEACRMFIAYNDRCDDDFPSMGLAWEAAIEVARAAIARASLNPQPLIRSNSDGADENTQRKYRVGDFIGRSPVLCEHGSIDPNNLCPQCESPIPPDDQQEGGGQ